MLGFGQEAFHIGDGKDMKIELGILYMLVHHLPKANGVECAEVRVMMSASKSVMEAERELAGMGNAHDFLVTVLLPTQLKWLSGLPHEEFFHRN